jgi:hypothetical protein
MSSEVLASMQSSRNEMNAITKQVDTATLSLPQPASLNAYTTFNFPDQYFSMAYISACHFFQWLLLFSAKANISTFVSMLNSFYWCTNVNVLYFCRGSTYLY